MRDSQKCTSSTRRKDGNNFAFPFPKFLNRSVGNNSNGDHDVEDQCGNADSKDKPNDEIILAAEKPDPAQCSESKKHQNLWVEGGTHRFKKNS